MIKMLSLHFHKFSFGLKNGTWSYFDYTNLRDCLYYADVWKFHTILILIKLSMLLVVLYEYAGVHKWNWILGMWYVVACKLNPAFHNRKIVLIFAKAWERTRVTWIQTPLQPLLDNIAKWWRRRVNYRRSVTLYRKVYIEPNWSLKG